MKVMAEVVVVAVAVVAANNSSEACGYDNNFDVLPSFNGG